jgi:hypothetical protein
MTDQLARLLAGGDGGHASTTFMVGTLAAWDPATFNNRVTAEGLEYRNLAVLISFYAPADWIEQGDAVLLGRTDGAPVILGSLWLPGKQRP